MKNQVDLAPPVPLMSLYPIPIAPDIDLCIQHSSCS